MRGQRKNKKDKQQEAAHTILGSYQANSVNLYIGIRKRLTIHAWLVVLLMAICGCSSKGNTEKQYEPQLAVSSKGYVTPPQVAQDAIESSISFRGWLDGKAVLRQEQLLEDGDFITSFFLVRPNSILEQMDHEIWRDKDRDDDELPLDPPGLQDGNVLVLECQMQDEKPEIAFEIDVNTTKLTAFEEAVANWTSEKELPSIQAALRLQQIGLKERKRITLWEDSVELSPYFGECGLEYKPPELVSAVLSPVEKTLLFELLIEGEHEFFMVPWLKDRSGYQKR